MKPPPFDYVAARSAGDVLAALAEDGAQVLAGGQSLMLEMNYRRARPRLVVDVNRVPGLDRVDRTDGGWRIGPLVRHRAFEQPPDRTPREAAAPREAGATGRGPLGELLGRVVRHIAHPPIRARGTMAGSAAYAHPAAEWPGVLVALDGRLELAGVRGSRTVAAGDFFRGPFVTDRRPDEFLAAIHLPDLPAGTRVGFVEHRRTHASFAELAVVVALTLEEDRVATAAIGLINAADRPVRARTAEQELVGRPLTDDVLAAAGRAAGEDDADPRPQPHADLRYQRHAVAVLTRRALAQARDGG
jgi:aerobic carbon-monoxide dehydrogenase medium subunit